MGKPSRQTRCGKSGDRGAQVIGPTAMGPRALGPTVAAPVALAACAVGAVAVGAMAIGRLAVAKAVVRELEAGDVRIRSLAVDHLEVAGERWPGPAASASPGAYG